MEDLVEKYAIRMARGNNGGEWATHYNEDQKNFWRNIAREMLDDISRQISPQTAE
jgi:phage pi2 protein 07